MQPQGLYRATLCHPLTLATTEILSVTFRMATPRYPSAPLDDSLCSSPRHTIRHPVSSHRVYMLSFPPTPVWHTSALWRLSPRITRVAPRVEFSAR
jgi:hypothetical protein